MNQPTSTSTEQESPARQFESVPVEDCTISLICLTHLRMPGLPSESLHHQARGQELREGTGACSTN